MQNNSSVIKSKKGIQIIKREGKKTKKTKNIGSADRLFNVQMFAPVTLFSFHNPTVH